MPFMNWDDSFNVHVPEMNAEHENILSIINALYDKNGRSDKAVIRALLDDLFGVTSRHFTHEEAYMEKIQYADLDTHKVIHQQLMDSLQQHIAAFDANGGELSDDFFSFVRMWLQAHIKCIDVKYGTP